MSTYVFSQNFYPKKILWENDTVLAITKSQLITINRSLNSYIHLKKITENLQMDLSVSDSIISLYKKTLLVKDSIIDKEVQKYETTRAINDDLKYELSKERKKRKTALSLGIGGSVVGLILGILLGN